jgi:hypothetical protein
MTGWYPAVREALLARGWHENGDRESFYFDLKWTLRSTELKQAELQPLQLTNHFLKNTAITTKVGLMKNLKQLIWHMPIDVDEIFPRCFDLSSGDDLQNFMDDFQVAAAEAMLKQLVVRVLGVDACMPPSALPTASRPASAMPTVGEEGEGSIAGMCAPPTPRGDDGDDGVVLTAGDAADSAAVHKAVSELITAVVAGSDESKLDNTENNNNNDDATDVMSVVSFGSVGEGAQLMVNDGMLRTALAVVRKSTGTLDDAVIDDPTASAAVRPLPPHPAKATTARDGGCHSISHPQPDSASPKSKGQGGRRAATGRLWLKGDLLQAYYPISGEAGWFDAQLVKLGYRSHLGHYLVRYEADDSEGWVCEVRSRR